MPTTITTTIKTNRTFGVEIEFCNVTARKLLFSLRKRGLVAEAEGYNHETRNHWKITTDSSVYSSTRIGSDGFRERGLELVSPILSGEDGLKQLKKAVEALRVCGAEVNLTTGMHVHVGVGDLSVDAMKNLVKSLVRDEHLLDLFIADHRKSNIFCMSNVFGTRIPAKVKKETRDAELVRIFLEIDHARDMWYVGDVAQRAGRQSRLNLGAYASRKTIEFRSKEATLEYSEVLGWVKLVVELTNFAAKRKNVQLAKKTHASTTMLAERMLKKAGPDVAEYFGTRLATGARGI